MGMPGFPGINGVPGVQGPPGSSGLSGRDGCNGTDVRVPNIFFAINISILLNVGLKLMI